MEPVASFFIGRTIFIVFAILFVFGAFFIVKQKTAVIIERLGKFNRVARSGFNLKIPIIDKKAGVVNLKVMELPVEVETKTKDDVFVRLIISVQYYVVETQEGISTSFYKFDNPARQIQSYVFDSIRSEVPNMLLDDVFSEKDKIAKAVQVELADTMEEYGFAIIKALITDIDPDQKVKHAMNEINAAKRLKEAAREYAEAEKIKVVAAAEAEAESKKLQGVGIADQRIAIANGMKQSVEQVKGAMEADVTGQQVMNMLFMTQHYDTISRLADQGVNTIFVPYSPGTVGDLQTQIQSSLIAADTITKTTQGKDYKKGVKKKDNDFEDFA
ncbi:SPFH domain-containing protein [Vicingus serpentipes]|jgi:regulator of protease activity HflC (stomatin/prohibitin superfamily)|uniref:SPFH domain-containing protein n=1 Tax=Vicingus serpentipes TaxID=1926625 RepID=A0A5C6RU69_9FLAO|nr:SPFH domain-containing protein [Vicingus serpentipes]TXB65200.1 SPFH domain-containing protein [Vicingus serpentipes]